MRTPQCNHAMPENVLSHILCRNKIQVVYESFTLQLAIEMFTVTSTLDIPVL